MDITCCVLALPVLGLSAAIMTVIVRVISPGPIFFRQERIGLRKERFMIFKFRTMTVNADSMVHRNHVNQLMASQAPMTKLDATHDARLIPGGWILRASGLDELPQIINVLRGEMSLVGPRPCIPSESHHHLPAHGERFDVLPGLTGLWQVSGKNRTTFDEMMRLDIHYARNASFLLNLKIVLLTPWALLVQIYDTRIGRRGATPPRSPESTVRN
jgi:lipopolysaccharide/colanic/teichoic acid biosynthesis glycosyltransferase